MNTHVLLFHCTPSLAICSFHSPMLKVLALMYTRIIEALDYIEKYDYDRCTVALSLLLYSKHKENLFFISRACKDNPFPEKVQRDDTHDREDNMNIKQKGMLRCV